MTEKDAGQTATAPTSTDDDLVKRLTEGNWYQATLKDGKPISFTADSAPLAAVARSADAWKRHPTGG